MFFFSNWQKKVHTNICVNTLYVKKSDYLCVTQ